MDVTVRVPHVDTPHAGVRPRVTVMDAETAKVRHYTHAFQVNDSELVPLALDPVGAMGRAGVDFIRKMARATADPRSYKYQVFLRELFPRVSVALQNGNGWVLRWSSQRSRS